MTVAGGSLDIKRHLSFEQVLEDIIGMGEGLSLQLKIKKGSKKVSLIELGYENPLVLTVTNVITREVSYYSLFESHDYEASYKELKKFQRLFKKITGISLLKNRYDNLSGRPIWTAYI